MKLIWSLRAKNKLQNILEYIAENDPTAALQLVEAIMESAEKTLADHPNAGRPGRVADTREWVAHKRYIVVYRVEREQVKIITVRHTSPQWPKRF